LWTDQDLIDHDEVEAVRVLSVTPGRSEQENDKYD
jgi:hypothetical protein